MSNQKHVVKQTELPISKVSFREKNTLRKQLLVKQKKEQILLVSADVTHYCVLGYN
jgi:hypothetical protein